MAASQLNILQKSLEDARKSLINTDVRIEKVTGRKPIEKRPVGRGRLISTGNGPLDPMRQRTRSWNASDMDNNLPPAKRPIISISAPLMRPSERDRRDGSSSEDEGNKPTLQSVVAGGKRGAVRTGRTQSDLTEQAPSKSNRNKRMLGVLMGTLTRFKADQNKEAQTGKDKKRQEIENRVEDERVAVREEMAAQRKDLFQRRKTQQRDVMELERKMQVAESFREWEEHYTKLSRFIKTKAKPHIYYKPKLHNKTTQELLDKHAQDCRDHISKLQASMKEDMEGKVMGPVGAGLDTRLEPTDSADFKDLGELEGRPAELNITDEREGGGEEEGMGNSEAVLKSEVVVSSGRSAEVVVNEEGGAKDSKVSDVVVKMEPADLPPDDAEGVAKVKMEVDVVLGLDRHRRRSSPPETS